jgi:hypothetical protein
MHTGIISFADRIVHNIKTNETKDFILEQLYILYNIKIIQKHCHKLDENNIKYVRNNPHLCNLRSNGNPYYMFLTLYNDIPIIYFIDKKVHPGYQKPRILLVRGLFDESLFKNTLIDGEMVRCNDGKWEFLINDILVYEGKHLTKSSLPERLQTLYKMFNTQYTPNEVIDVCAYKIKTYYHTYKESIQKLIEISRHLKYTSRGIYFWSYDLKYKPKLYNFNEDNIVSVTRKVKDETKFQVIKNEDSSEFIPLNNLEITVIQNIQDTVSEKTLWISQTEYPDVYNIYDSENVLSSQKKGIALIPNLLISKLIRNAFRNKNAAHVLKVRCLFNNIFNKWYPIEIL